MRIGVPGEFHEERWHLPQDGHPASATGRRPYIGFQKDTMHRSPKRTLYLPLAETLLRLPKGDHCIRHRKDTRHRASEGHTAETP